MRNKIKEFRKRISYTPENIGGGCMTGKVLTSKEAKEISSYIADYKSNKNCFSSKAKPSAEQKVKNS